MAPNLEQLVPGLAEARAKERQHRALAFLGLTWTVCGREVRPLTPRHRLGLQMLRNAFTDPTADPLEGDVFEFLWFLSPEWAPTGTMFRQWRLRRHVRRLDLRGAVQEIYAFLIAQLQDSTEQCGKPGPDNSPWVHWAADDASWWMSEHGGFTLESYLDTPYLILHQLYRAWRCSHPRMTSDSSGKVTVEEPQFINRSDQLVGLWQRERRAAVIEHILNQRERRN